MSTTNKILCIIPARGGSTRLPKKNIKMIGGKPMIAHAIGAALHSRLISHVLVSTDDVEIAEVAKKYGADVPFIRPAELATDTASTLDVLIHAVNYYESASHKTIESIVLVQPTAPLIIQADIDNAINSFIEQNVESCVSMCEVSERPEWSYTMENGNPKPFGEFHNITSRSQDLPQLYRINGAVYVSSRKLIMDKHKILDEKSLAAIIMPRERSVDIDTMTDFIIADALFKSI